MDATWLSSGLLVPFVLLSVLGCYFAFVVIWIFVLYPFVFLARWSRCCIYMFLVGSVVNYCDVTTCDNFTRIACMFRHARYVWWAFKDRYYANFGENAKTA